MVTPPGWRREGNLPPEPTTFVGRLDQLHGLEAALAESRLVTVVGTGGAGKTRLALRAADNLRDRFPDGVWFTDLSPLQSPELLIHTLLQMFGLRDQTGRAASAILSDFLADKQLLMLLDTCDQHVDACAGLASTLLQWSPDLMILATSREPLGAAEELQFPLPPLALPRLDQTVEELKSVEAISLFLDRAMAVRPGFAPGECEMRQIAEICRRLDGLPLAVELAAGRISSHPPKEILDQLSEQMLDSTSPTDLHRHQTLRSAIGWSHQLCQPDERLLWARLSVFAGSFNVDAAQYVCSTDELSASQIASLLNELVAKSILQQEEAPEGERYRLLDSLRAYGTERRDDLGESTWLLRRYRDYYVALAARGEAAWSGSRQRHWFVRMLQEHSHIRAVMEQCLADPAETEAALSFAGSLWYLWHACGLTREGRYYLDRALEVSRRPSPERCKALWVAAFVSTGLGDNAGAKRFAQRCSSEAVKIGDSNAVVMATKMMGLCAYVTGELPKAQAYLGAALGSLRTDKDLNPGLLPAIVELAFVLNSQGDPEEAESLLSECLDLCTENGELWLRSWAHSAMAETHRALGRTRKATESAVESLRIKRQFHDVLGALQIIEMLSWLAVDEEPVDAAAASRAAILIGAAGAGWRHFGLNRLYDSPIFLAHARECEAKARIVLGDAAFKDAMARGAEYDFDAAIVYALSQSTP